MPPPPATDAAVSTATATQPAPKSRRPANTAFKQQRLKAWQPILTPRTVLPTFFIVGLICLPLGIGLYVASDHVVELSFDYTQCANQAPSVRTDHRDGAMVAWSYTPSTRICSVTFTVDKAMEAPVFLYYRLSNFYQNHRRYVKSVSSEQMKGKPVTTDCDPLETNPDNNLPYYPCGLIANSMFNDTIGTVSSADYSSFQIAKGTTTASTAKYTFVARGITWSSDQSKYGQTQYDMSAVSPPKDWIGGTYRGVQVKSTWGDSGIQFNPKDDEHFQVWMRTSGLPTFRKLYGKNTADDLPVGTYTIDIEYNFPVLGFDGAKSIVISTSSFLGGKNPFLGITYMLIGVLCIVLGGAFLAKHLISPRKLGDHTYLSWNQQQATVPVSSPH